MDMVQVKHDGSVKLINVNTVENKDGNLVAAQDRENWL